MYLNYYFKNVDNEINKDKIKYNKDNNMITFKIDNDSFLIDLKEDIIRKENNDSMMILKFNDKKNENGSYYIKELDSIFDLKTKTHLIDKNDKYHVKYKMWLDDELIGDFEIKIEYKEK